MRGVLDEEKSRLSAETARVRRALKQLRERIKTLTGLLKKERDEVKFWKKKYEEERSRSEQLESKIRDIEKQRDRYRDMIFKPNRKRGEDLGVPEDPTDSQPLKKKRKPGAQPGHKGYGRKKPERVDEEKRIYLDKCPTCETKLRRSQTVKSHTVEDIPAIEESRVKVARYQTEVQWCPKCKVAVKARAIGVIPRCRLGVNVLLFVLINKYISRQPWAVIVTNLYNWYGLRVSKGSLVNMMHRAREWMGSRYDDLLEQIRGSTVKYADETSWRVNGVGHWLWGFFSDKYAFYTIEASRGKAVAEKVLKDSHPDDVLVRDDYGGYTKLPLKHQSCWAHLLRKSHESDSQPDASTEVRRLHEQLKKMFSALQTITRQPFDLNERRIAYKLYKREIQQIIDTDYKCDDSKEIQTRISNQSTNLITALLYKNVPLTNNYSERNIRIFVVTRKISGGSRSDKGAKTHSVLMSIMQSISLQKLPILLTLKKYLLDSHFPTTE